MRRHAFLLLVLGACKSSAAPAPAPKASAPAPAPEPTIDVESLHLPAIYTNVAAVSDLAIVSTMRASPYAVKEAAYLIRSMLGHRPDILGAISGAHVHVTVLAHDEMTTDVPDYATLEPKQYWDRRARGIGANEARPAVSCGEENLLEIPGDPYDGTSVLIHEFAHTTHTIGMKTIDPTFDGRLHAAYDHAHAYGLWGNSYSMANYREYWAEGAQAWFDAGKQQVNTRVKLQAYDPDLAKLLLEVYGDRPWRYVKPSARPPEERQHLAGLDVSKLGRFVWPAEIATPDLAAGPSLEWLRPNELPTASPKGRSAATTILFRNRRSQPITLEWVKFDGGTRPLPVEIQPKRQHPVNTFAGHVWRVLENGKVIGGVVGAGTESHIDVLPDGAHDVAH